MIRLYYHTDYNYRKNILHVTCVYSYPDEQLPRSGVGEEVGVGDPPHHSEDQTQNDGDGNARTNTTSLFCNTKHFK